jgi:UDP-glucose 4-epimerase
VTGGCGFIGLNTVHLLLKKRICDRLVIVDNLSVGKLEDLERVLDELGRWKVVEGKGGRGRAVRFRKYSLELNFQESPGGRESRAPGMGLSSRRATDSHGSCRVEFHKHDIRNRKGLDEIVGKASAVIHLAAQTGVIPSLENPLYDMEQNVRGTVNLLEACRSTGVRRFVFASSSAPLGEQEPPINESKVPRPLSPYGASKLAGEGYCSAYAGSFGLETIALRFSNVYGPRSTYKNSVVARFVKNILAGDPLTIYGTGSQTRDFIYTEDLCSAIEKALSTTDPRAFGAVFQIATFRETTVNELAEKLKAIAKRAGMGPVLVQYESERAGEIRRSFSDISRARDLLGYRPEYDLDRGLQATWNRFVSRREEQLTQGSGRCEPRSGAAIPLNPAPFCKGGRGDFGCTL